MENTPVDVGRTPWRFVAAQWALVGTLVVLWVARDAWNVHHGEDPANYFTIGLVVLGSIAVAVSGWWFFLVYLGRRRLISRVRAARPGMPVFKAVAVPETIDDAVRADASTAWVGSRASRRSSNRGGGWPMVVAVLPDRVEPWFISDREPRWSVSRADLSVSVVGTAVGYRAHWAVVLDDGERSLYFRPQGKGRGRAARTEAFAQVLTTLGENPADYIVLSDPTERPTAG